jgi:hypothetical protein
MRPVRCRETRKEAEREISVDYQGPVKCNHFFYFGYRGDPFYFSKIQNCSQTYFERKTI